MAKKNAFSYSSKRASENFVLEDCEYDIAVKSINRRASVSSIQALQVLTTEVNIF